MREHDEILSTDEIEKFEEKIHIEFPEKYKQFLSEYGGGYFGYANVYSLDEGSDFYILHNNDVPVDKYLRIADNDCGDYHDLYNKEPLKCQIKSLSLIRTTNIS